MYKRQEYLRADAVIAEVRLEAELFVGFNGVVALILKGIGLQLVGEANAPAFLTHVDDRAPAFLFDAGQRGGKLVAADVYKRQAGLCPAPAGLPSGPARGE